MAATYEGGDTAFLDRIVPAVDYLEITPDSIADIKEGRPRLKEAAVHELQTIGKETKVLVHGVGLSIGTASGWNETYLHLLDQLLPHVNLQWHSEHLGF